MRAFALWIRCLIFVVEMMLRCRSFCCTLLPGALSADGLEVDGLQMISNKWDTIVDWTFVDKVSRRSAK